MRSICGEIDVLLQRMNVFWDFPEASRLVTYLNDFRFEEVEEKNDI